MNFRALPDHLHDTARATAKYFAKEYGVTGLKAETEIYPMVEFNPTLHGTLNDKSLICIEVTENPAPSELREFVHFVLECRNKGIPAKLWVSLPKGAMSQLSTKEISFARDNGVGIIVVDEYGNGTQLVGPPLSQSLTGVRAVEYSAFPSAYREALRGAHDTFKNGNPSKGCSLVYDELESLTRKILKKCMGKTGFLKKAVQFDPDTAAWHSVLEFLKAQLDLVVSDCPQLRGVLFNRLIGVTEHRNDSGHKPTSTKKLVDRDKQLRTRFESAVDELLSLINASRPLKL